MLAGNIRQRHSNIKIKQRSTRN